MHFAAYMYQSRIQRALVDAFRRALVMTEAAASRVGALESLLSKLAAVLADAHHMRRNGTLDVGKSPEAGASPEAIS